MQEKYQFSGPRLAKPWCSWILPSSTSALLKYSGNFWTTHDAETRDRTKRVMTTHNGILRSLIIKPHSNDIPLRTMEFIDHWLLDHEWDRNIWSREISTTTYGRSHEVIRYWTTRETETYDHMEHIKILKTSIPNHTRNRNTRPYEPRKTTDTRIVRSSISESHVRRHKRLHATVLRSIIGS